MRAASSTHQGNGVAIRWTLEKGWIPDGGFNLYRIEDGGDRTLLNRKGPIGAKPGQDPAITPLWKNSDRPAGSVVDYQTAIQKAQNLPAKSDEEKLRVFSPPHSRPDPSKHVFDALGKQSQVVHQPGTTLPDRMIQHRVDDAVVKAYRETLHTAAVQAPTAQVLSAPYPLGSPKKVASASQLSPVEEARRLRTTLLVGAMAHQGVAKDLGLGFDDTDALRLKHYQYSLWALDKDGHEIAEVAQATIPNVGEDSAVVPKGLVAQQIDAETVGLRWERPTPAEVHIMGTASYQVYRVGKDGLADIPVNRSPIVIGDIPLKDGRYLEPATFVHDKNVPIGDVNYKLVQFDMFGRRAETEILKFVMKDWHTPPPPTRAQAELTGRDVTIAWQTKPGDPASPIQYRVYRKDSENNNSKPELLTKPVSGEVFDIQNYLNSQNKRGRLARALERSPDRRGWLSFVDKNVPVDHRYQYLVTAAYSKNDIESSSVVTTSVPIPLETAPPPPSNLAHAPVQVLLPPPSTPPKPIPLSDGYVIKGKNGSRSIKLPSTYTSVREQDTGAKVTLTWNAVAATPSVTYRVYRASATGLFMDRTDKTNQAMSDQKSTQAPLSVHPSAPNSAVRNFAAPTIGTFQLGNNSLRYVEEYAATPNDFTFIGEVRDKTTYTDDIPRSQAHNYVYRVVAVNRWGVPAGGPKEGIPGTEVKVHVPATMPPSAPAVVSVAADTSGHIEVLFRPNPKEENVKRYKIKRARIDSAAPKTASTSKAAQAKAAERFGIRAPESAMQLLTRSNPNIQKDVQQGGTSKVNYEEIGTVNTQTGTDGTLNFIDGKVSAHQVYSYYVVAIADGLESRSGSHLCSTEISADYVGPKPALVTSCDNVQLNWEATQDAKAYILERAFTASPATSVQLTGVRAQRTYVDYSVQPGESYSYRVIAVTAEGNVSAKSPEATANVPAN